jgi:hypothetical protein
MTVSDIKWPPHKCDLILTHNQHKSYYRTVIQLIEEEYHGYTDWVSEAQKQKAIETDECWTLQWYPETPIGFRILAAADLDVLLEASLKEEDPPDWREEK